MKLVDIKKLKVTELRSRLTELGLDSRGLKADLVDRLWSASQSVQSPEHVELLEGSPSTLSGPEPGAVQVRTESSSPPVADCVPAPCEVDRGRQYTDTATQTEPEPGPPAVPPGSERLSGAETVCQADGRQLGHSDGSVCEEMGRGRAFYEFKEEIRYKRSKSPQLQQDKDEEEWDEDKVRLDPYGCHLHFEVSSDESCGQPRFWDRFPLLWSGCRLTHGVRQGRVGFEVRLERKLLTSDQEVKDPYRLRVGWSVSDSSLLLGEDKLSFAYDGRGKKVSDGTQEEYGEPLSEGDIIGCYAAFSANGAVELFFHKNGHFLGAAFTLSASLLQGRVLVPHVLLKNCSVRFLLDRITPQWYPGPMGFTPLTSLPAGQRVCVASAPTSKMQSEVVMMVGLPGSGKSFWAHTLMKQHPEKKYRLLGTEDLLACMLSGGQRDSRLQQASQCLTDLIKVAAKTPGNYILDQCNVLFSARRHKLQLFAGFRRVVIVIFPSAGEWKRRLLRRQISDGEHIPETALLKLQVSCSLPEPQPDLMEELQYAELPQEQAQILLMQYKEEAHRLLPPVIKPDKKPRWNKRRRHFLSPPPSNRMQWGAVHGWYNTRSDIQPWSQQPETRHWNLPYQQQNYNYSRSFSGYPSYS
ncbi:heterogeneous nuclear ribonucleoprotein U-like protein 2 isoform X2 [Poeciliopsis prolifica]|uniref:heterogeneous nuclear ribonucleoprotein U-like protein 2 isoform X2 n=1 Tax=Poeciliopsis prolifica TaxID=188132 RepID=UPI0024131C9D|nr:heterogeneous nuclear ribonucleoprotein U-like protein 2 isoform X2 [Poeciliopsis prolifica]